MNQREQLMNARDRPHVNELALSRRVLLARTGAADSSREPARRLRNRVIILWWLDDGRLSRLYSVVEQVTGSVLIERWQHSGRLLLHPGAYEGRC